MSIPRRPAPPGIPHDAIIVGAGPAGLTAATYLARFRRRTLIFGAGPPRANWIPESHNTPGFPQGVPGPELMRRLEEQARAFGVEIRDGLATGLKAAEGLFEVEGPEGSMRAACVLLATGVVDRLPPLEGLEAAIRRSLVRMCPICDAYEAIGKAICVLGDGALAQREAAFLRTYSDHVRVVGEREGTIALGAARAVWTRPDGGTEAFDHLYLALGCEPQGQLAAGCGAARDQGGNLIVDAQQMTTVEGLFAAGDVVRGLNQIAVATGEAAIAATAIHNRLRGAA